MSSPERNVAAGPGWLPHPVLSQLLGAADSLVVGNLIWGEPFIREKRNMGFIKDSLETLKGA